MLCEHLTNNWQHTLVKGLFVEAADVGVNQEAREQDFNQESKVTQIRSNHAAGTAEFRVSRLNILFKSAEILNGK